MSATQLPAYQRIISSVSEILAQDQQRDEKLLAICKLLSDEVDTFDWVGFYLADPEGKKELVLGPYVGPSTDHTRIPYGRGICGQVAVSHETFVSQDVNSEDNYLSCSATVQSEIVAPIMKEGEFVAQIDIDSNTKASITEEQRNLIEEICEMLTEEF